MKIMNGLNLQNRPISNLSDPSAAQDAATKNYVDGVVRGLDWKYEVIAASTGNVSLSAPGTSLDGVTLSASMQTIPGIGNVTRVLLKDQTTASENGVYDWTASGAALTRSIDSSTGAQISGSTYTVQRGTVNADRVYRVTTDDPLTVGTTAIAFVQVGAASQAYTQGNGISISSGVISFVPKSGGGLLVDGTGAYIDNTLYTRKYVTNIGDGSTTSLVVTHNLGSRDVDTTVMDNTSFEVVYPDIFNTTTNTITVTFGTAPASAAYRVTING